MLHMFGKGLGMVNVWIVVQLFFYVMSSQWMAWSIDESVGVWRLEIKGFGFVQNRMDQVF